MFEASSLLAGGSFILLAGFAFETLVGGWGFWLFFSAIAAIPVHLIAWLGLGRALLALKDEPSVRPLRKWGMAGAFLASLLGFGVGMSTLSLVVQGPKWFADVLVFLFPYVPSVYAPVVASHAVLFILGARTLRTRRDSTMVLGGSLYLLLASAAAVVGQVLSFPMVPGSLLPLAGLTGFGYVTVAVGWSREYRNERRSRLREGAGEDDSCVGTCVARL
jgi:hypothetical protein